MAGLFSLFQKHNNEQKKRSLNAQKDEQKAPQGKPHITRKYAGDNGTDQPFVSTKTKKSSHIVQAQAANKGTNRRASNNSQKQHSAHKEKPHVTRRYAGDDGADQPPTKTKRNKPSRAVQQVPASDKGTKRQSSNNSQSQHATHKEKSHVIRRYAGDDGADQLSAKPRRSKLSRVLPSPEKENNPRSANTSRGKTRTQMPLVRRQNSEDLGAEKPSRGAKTNKPSRAVLVQKEESNQQSTHSSRKKRRQASKEEAPYHTLPTVPSGDKYSSSRSVRQQRLAADEATVPAPQTQTVQQGTKKQDKMLKYTSQSGEEREFSSRYQTPRSLERMETLHEEKEGSSLPRFRRRFVPGNVRINGALYDASADLLSIKNLSHREHTMDAVSKSQLSNRIQDRTIRSFQGPKPGKIYQSTDLVIERLRAKRQLSPLVQSRTKLRNEIDTQRNRVATTQGYSR